MQRASACSSRCLVRIRVRIRAKGRVGVGVRVRRARVRARVGVGSCAHRSCAPRRSAVRRLVRVRVRVRGRVRLRLRLRLRDRLRLKVRVRARPCAASLLEMHAQSLELLPIERAWEPGRVLRRVLGMALGRVLGRVRSGVGARWGLVASQPSAPLPARSKR